RLRRPPTPTLCPYTTLFRSPGSRPASSSPSPSTCAPGRRPTASCPRPWPPGERSRSRRLLLLLDDCPGRARTAGRRDQLRGRTTVEISLVLDNLQGAYLCDQHRHTA